MHIRLPSKLRVFYAAVGNASWSPLRLLVTSLPLGETEGLIAWRYAVWTRVLKLTVALLIAIITVIVVGSAPSEIRDATIGAACCGFILVLYSRVVLVALDRLLGVRRLPSEDGQTNAEHDGRDMP